MQPMDSLTNCLIQKWKRKFISLFDQDFLINSGKMLSADHALHRPNSKLRQGMELNNKQN